MANAMKASQQCGVFQYEGCRNRGISLPALPTACLPVGRAGRSRLKM
ncbi:hypothetical protein L6259_00865 [Candidatus Parcubacteria bacterium]|nr:hypothetical protein [Candidatus Parcubacteria bacterium]